MLIFRIHEIILKVVASPAKHDKIIIVNIIIGSLANVALWVALAFNFLGAKELITLRYNIYFGISSFGAWYNIFILPLAGLLVMAVNICLAFALYLRYKLLSYFLILAVVLFNLAVLTTGGLLMYINF